MRKRLHEATWDEMRRLIREEEPPRPSARLSTSNMLASVAASRQIDPKQLTGLVRGELDWIVMKALEKDRNRRYETANGMAMDVQRYLANEAVLAAPPSTAYRFRKFVRRNRAQVIAGGVVAAALVLGMIGTGLALNRALRAESSLRAQLNETEKAQKAEKTRADELKQVSEFQDSMLTQVDATAERPFTGPLMELLDQKRNQSAPLLFRRSGLPSDLAQFADRLLNREPTVRPDPLDIARFLSFTPESKTSKRSDSQELELPQTLSPSGQLLLGREQQLAQLRALVQRLQQEHCPLAVFVSGRSGEGKTTLVEKFLEPFRAGREVLILSGRCYDRETVPFKAIDSLIDSLVAYLRGKQSAELNSMLPEDTRMLAHRIPVLGLEPNPRK